MLLLAAAAYNPYIFLGISLLLLVSVLASKASEWLGVPALLIFLVIGMLAGSEGPGGISVYPTVSRQSTLGMTTNNLSD